MNGGQRCRPPEGQRSRSRIHIALSPSPTRMAQMPLVRMEIGLMNCLPREGFPGDFNPRCSLLLSTP